VDNSPNLHQRTCNIGSQSILTTCTLDHKRRISNSACISELGIRQKGHFRQWWYHNWEQCHCKCKAISFLKLADMPPQKGWRKGIKHKEVGLGHIQSYGKPSQLRILSCYHVLGRVPINLIRGADDQKDVLFGGSWISQQDTSLQCSHIKLTTF
jgi:hypothetical protein